MSNSVKVTILNGGPRKSVYMYEVTRCAEGFEFFWDKVLQLLKQRNYPMKKYRLFWIDADNDEIDVLTKDDVGSFFNVCEKPHLFVSYLDEEEKAAQAKKTEQAALTGFVHKRVSCDGCNMPEIVGFRYKCLECSNFDLCENCESKHVHKEHLMMRMPDDKHREYALAFTGGFDAMQGSFRKRGQRRACPFVLAPREFVATTTKAATSPASGAEEATDASKSRKRSKQQLASMPAIGFSKFLDMLNDLADGGSNAAQTATNAAAAASNAALNTANEAVAAAAAAASASVVAAKQAQNITNNNAENTQNADNKRMQTALNAACKSMEPVVDPYEIKKSVEILSNFSELFGKMLDAIEPATSTSTLNESFKEQEKEITEVAVKLAATEKRANSIDNDWQMVGEQQSPSSLTSTIPANDATANNNGEVNYEQLSNDLQTHLKVSAEAENAATPAAAAAAEPERRAVPVYHQDSRINEAILGMMAMGFSNEGGALTELLVSTDGNIAAALDIITIARRADV